MHTDTRRMIERVESLTGYRVSILSGSGFTGFARMMTGSPQKPVHAITINQKYSQIGDYIVALQCAMLLIKWSAPKKIPVFTAIDEKVDELIAKTARDEKIANFPPDKTMGYAAMLVNGLLLQLVSIPSEMLAIEICRDECPGLADMMKTAVNIEIKEFHQVLEPDVRQMTPESIFKPNAAINAAFTLFWSKICGNEHALLPFIAADMFHDGKDLLKIFEDISDVPAEKHTRTVDEWALKMNLNSLYEWEYTEK